MDMWAGNVRSFLKDRRSYCERCLFVFGRLRIFSAVFYFNIEHGGMNMSLICIQNLSFCYDGNFENVFENVNLQLDTAWRLGLTGRNGRGKTTLLRLLMGEL